MLIRTDRGYTHPHSSEITPQSVYEKRRDFLKLMAGGVAGVGLAGWATREALAGAAAPGKLARLSGAASREPGAMTFDPLTPYKDVTTYNNF